MKNKHQKRIMGLGMQTKLEKSMKGLFGSYRFSKAWLDRKEAIKARVARKIYRVQVRKAERLQALKEGKPIVYSINNKSNWVSKRSKKVIKQN
jgi:hypothetical protein